MRLNIYPKPFIMILANMQTSICVYFKMLHEIELLDKEYFWSLVRER